MSSIPHDKLVPIDRIRDWDLPDYSDRRFCETKPMSDDVLDAGVQHLHISREMMGIVEDDYCVGGGL